MLVDTQGNLLAIKVLGAEGSDQQGAKRLLEPVADTFPRIKLLWGDSHYGGTLIGWLKEQLGWIMQPVRALTVPKRGVLVPEGSEVDWDKLFPSGFRPLPRRWVVERSLAWITRLSSPLSRPRGLTGKLGGLHQALGQRSHAHQARFSVPVKDDIQTHSQGNKSFLLLSHCQRLSPLRRT
jgi:transposase